MRQMWLGSCSGLNAYAPLNSHTEVLTPRMVFEVHLREEAISQKEGVSQQSTHRN